MQTPRVIVTNWMPKGVDGMCLHPRLILLRPARKDDAVLMAHELVHAEQMRRVGWFRWVVGYLLAPMFRQDAEAEAYRESYRLNPSGLHRYANALATLYRLDLTYAQAKALIQRQ
jgi:hypothetical protein